MKSPSASGAANKTRIPSRTAIASSSPLGLLALHLLGQWRTSGRDGLVFLAGDQDRAERIGSVLHSLDPSADVMVYPRLDSLPFDGLEPSREIAGRRASVLRRLAGMKRPAFLISTAEGIMERLPTPEASKRSVVGLKRGAKYSQQGLEKHFEDLGYDLEQEADYPGAVLFHGKTFEIFPAGALGPFRIEHDGDTIEKIVAFDPGEHDALSEVKELLIDPMSERVAFDRKGHRRALLTDYCGSAHWIADFEVPARADSWLNTIEQAVGLKEAEHEYMGRAEWNKVLKQVTLLPCQAAYEATPDFCKSGTPGKDLRSFVAETRRMGARLLLVAAVEEDLRKMERMAALRAERYSFWEKAARGLSNEGAVLADFDAGFVVSGKQPLVVVTATDVLGSRAWHLQPTAKAWTKALDEADFPEPGNIVVHLQRGLAKLDGLDLVETGQGPVREMVRLRFSGNDAVLLPPAELALIWPYAMDAGKLALDKADGSTWWERRGEAEREIQVAAKELVKHRAQRRRRQAAKLIAPSPAYEKFVARFPHITTADQTKAIQDVLGDLASGHPMDRIICGDVGFGKTEVALRAAAAAVLSGKQVAIAVPTTVLARQHVETFAKRFGPFGIEVGSLSRATSAAEVRAIKERLRSGELKIVVGTQALASKDVKFAELGLVIIDEEQHFGAAEKEKLSGLSKGLHALWMTATPIPRTLAAGLAGFRDISVIATPPVHRLPIVTKVAPLSDGAIAAALLREQRRRGRSFLICPRIRDLEPMRARLQSVVPDLSVVCLHGRLPVDEIDDRMMSFVEGKADVLLATNIVESGLDIPRANTVVVCWPEHFGLAQLHQLRGRVGRGGVRAFAYLLTEAETEASEKRLSALQELSRPGAGFAISARDLDLRGSGDLFSEKQSGHVQVFGPVLFSHLLKQASEKPGGAVADWWVPELNLPVAEMMPSGYVQSSAVRLDIYCSVARCRSEDDLDDVEQETMRRFGPLPAEAKDLFAAARLRLECRMRGILRMDVGPEAVAATFLPGRLPKRIGKPLKRTEDRVLYADEGTRRPFDRVHAFLEILGLDG
jgi:transcription-repair coupling factor (superfamily II helicase)